MEINFDAILDTIVGFDSKLTKSEKWFALTSIQQGLVTPFVFDKACEIEEEILFQDRQSQLQEALYKLESPLESVVIGDRIYKLQPKVGVENDN